MAIRADRPRALAARGRNEYSVRITTSKYLHVQRLPDSLFARWRIPG
jgi:hypothetical protein